MKVPQPLTPPPKPPAHAAVETTENTSMLMPYTPSWLDKEMGGGGGFKARDARPGQSSPPPRSQRSPPPPAPEALADVLGPGVARARGGGGKGGGER